MKTVFKKTAALLIAASIALTGRTYMPVEVHAEEITGEGQYIQTAENASSAPYIHFNTLYYTDGSEYASNGYVALKPEKDCYIMRSEQYGVFNLYDSSMEEVPSIYGIYGKLKANETYYVAVTRQFMLNNFDDEAGDSMEEATLINTNQEYDQSLATYVDKDYFKFVSDVTGKAKIIIQNNLAESYIEVEAKYYNSGISLWNGVEGVAPNDADSFYIDVKEGETYVLGLQDASFHYNDGKYRLQVVTAQVESIEFTPSQVSMNVQENYQLKPDILPENVVDNSVKYQSSNTNVATVSSEGMVYAKNAGTATIFCTAEDGSGTEGTCEIIVKNPIKEHTAVINALTNLGQGNVRVNAKKDKYAVGYQIKYSESKSMKNAKSVSTTGTSRNITKLKMGKKYYFQVRAYALDAEGNRIYSKYSPVKTVKVSKR